MRVFLLVLGAIPLVLALALGLFVALTWAPELPVAELKERLAPPPSVFVEAAGMQVHLRDEGPRNDPTPIVLLHGMGSSLHAWEDWVAALRHKRRVISFDLPGYGLTGPSPDRIYGRERDVAFVIAVLDKLRVGRVVLGGNSLGAGVSVGTAITHPSRVEALILVDGGYSAPSSSKPIGLYLLETPGINWVLSHTLPRFLVEQGMRNVWGDPGKVTREMVDRAVLLTQREGNRRAFIDRFTQRRPRAPARLADIKVPTLIIWGGRDRLIPIEAARALHREIAGSTLIVFDDLGHAPEEEDPARTVAEVKRFLSLE